MKINEEKLQEWKLLLEERKQKGMRVEEFCKEKNISVPQFYYYYKQVSKNQATKNQNTTKPIIKPIQIVNNPLPENNMIRFILPNSLQCVLPRDMSTKEIKGILELAMTC